MKLEVDEMGIRNFFFSPSFLCFERFDGAIEKENTKAADKYKATRKHI
jgi:hypothetical protein